MALATIEDYQARYPCDEIEDTELQALLDEATDLIYGELEPRHINRETRSAEYFERAARVCLGIVHRSVQAASASSIPLGATQASQTAGPYSMSATFGGGYGDVYLSKSDLKRLGIAQGAYMYVGPAEGKS